jgi:hypothetical protein
MQLRVIPWQAWAYGWIATLWIVLLAAPGDPSFNGSPGPAIALTAAVVAGVLIGWRIAWGVAVAFHAVAVGVLVALAAADAAMALELLVQGTALALLLSAPVRGRRRPLRAAVAARA